jgi:hypothetical protein
MARQRYFPSIERSLRRERWFKRMILLTTCLAVATLLSGVPRGRYLVGSAASATRQVARQVLGLPKPRLEIDESWRRYRELGIRDSRRGLDTVYAEAGPAMQRLMRYAGLDPERGLLRWGNFNLTLLLPSKVFEADDDGRSFRLRPRRRSIWLRNITLKSGVLMFFLVPDGPGLAEAIRGTTGIPVETSRQTTNSWGLRGPEPDLKAPVRGIVLGDSYMQGLFVGDDETPPEYLRRYLEGRLKTRVSILNTGVMGYSPEQYYYSLVAFAERFRPRFVVVSIFTNDFGDLHDVPMKGLGDWQEGKYWLDKIFDYCRTRQWPHLVVAAPYAPTMFGKRKTGFYPGLITNVLELNGLMFLDPTDSLIDAHLQLVIDGQRQGRRPPGCPLFNETIGDSHFSPVGSEAWADRVGRRIALLLEYDRVASERAAAARRANEPSP